MEISSSVKNKTAAFIKNVVVIGNAAQIVEGVVKLQSGSLIGESEKVDVVELAVRRLVSRISQKRV